MLRTSLARAAFAFNSRYSPKRPIDPERGGSSVSPDGCGEESESAFGEMRVRLTACDLEHVMCASDGLEMEERESNTLKPLLLLLHLALGASLGICPSHGARFGRERG